MRSQYKYYRLYYSLFALISFAGILTYQLTIRTYELFMDTRLSSTIGIFIAVFGLVIVSICAKKYFLQITGLRDLIESRAKNELIITGIHKVVRHPLYAGTFIFIWGLFIVYPFLNLFIADIVITIYTLIGLRFEEAKLEKEFGEAYRIYKQEVPMIIPKLVANSNDSY